MAAVKNYDVVRKDGYRYSAQYSDETVKQLRKAGFRLSEVKAPKAENKDSKGKA